MYSVPLRRALVTGSDLPYPEGVAAAEVLKVGAGSREGRLRKMPRGLSAIIAQHPCRRRLHHPCQDAYPCRGSRDLLQIRRRRHQRLHQLWSMAADRRRHLVGLSVGVAMFVGLLISWVVHRALASDLAIFLLASTCRKSWVPPSA
jgi:uncharacterized oligopeptide transporter (OPT) family protein